MFIVHVHVTVKPGTAEQFIEATKVNAAQSLQEVGVARFDFMQHRDDPNKFVLVEVYKTADDPARHKETSHYATWRDTVADLMAEPRRSEKYDNVFPAEDGWESA